jgi:hypothetical protein
MGARSHGHCRFCDKLQVSKEHIWNEWLQKLLPASGSRIESWWIGGKLEDFRTPRAAYNQVQKQGAVHTKVARKYCTGCNGGWMREIGEAAKPIATQLITAAPLDLGMADQRALATWIALAAMVADGQSRTPARFPDSDLEYMFRNRQPPPHWYVLVGQYKGAMHNLVEFEYAVANIRAAERSICAVQAISAILGNLFSLVLVHSGIQVAMDQTPIAIHYPHLAPILPSVIPVLRFPPPAQAIITGRLSNHEGGLARDLATRYVAEFSARLEPLLKQRNAAQSNGPSTTNP